MCFCTGYSHSFFPTPPWQQQQHQQTENAKDFGFVLTIWSSSGSSPQSPNFQCVYAVWSLKAALFAFLSQLAWLCKANLQQYMENRKKGHLSLLLTLSKEIIQVASAEIFCCVTCISYRDFSWQNYVDHRFLNRYKISQVLGTVSLQQINGCCITYFNIGGKMGF